MSGEFGEYNVQGYIDDQIASVARTCKYDGSGMRITKLWGEVFGELVCIAHEIAYAEECDTSEATAILESMKQLPNIQKALDNVRQYLKTFESVIEESIHRKEHGQ